MMNDVQGADDGLAEATSVAAVSNGARIFGAAIVLSSEGDRKCEVMLEEEGAGHGSARIPHSLQYQATPGDLLLVAGDSRQSLFVLSVLETSRQSSQGANERQYDAHNEMGSPGVNALSDSQLVTNEGAAASVTGDGHRIAVTSADGDLLFEYDSAADVARICSGTRLEVAAVRGMRFTSAGQISFESSEFRVKTDRARFEVGALDYEGQIAKAKVDRLRIVAGRIETVARTLVSRAVNAFSKVQELSQLRTGRRRVLAEEEYYLRCEKAAMRSRKEFKVDGERIELG